MTVVSVVIPCYNLGMYLNEAVESVLDQTYQDFEVIVVNDGSTEAATLNVLNRIDHSRVKVIHTPNRGVAAARNEGIRIATGKYILPLDADDRIAPTYLQKAVKIMQERPEAGIVYCEAEFFGEMTGKWQLPEYRFPDILFSNAIFCTGLFRKSDWERAGGYNSNMIYLWEDHDFWLSIIELGREVVRIPETLFFYRQRAGSRNRAVSRQREIASYVQMFRNHSALYTEHIDALITLMVDLKAMVQRLAQPPL
jgi:glycosyltransferase involved in cell wall biosynthesis